MNLEIKQKFVNGCNSLGGEGFLSVCIEYLREIESKNDLDDFVKIINAMYIYKGISTGDVLVEFCTLLREQIYAVLLEKGDIPENFYIDLYSYFSGVKLPVDERFESYESFVEKNFVSPQVSDRERVYLAVLGFISCFANSREYAVKGFLLKVIKIHLVSAEDSGFTYQIIGFLDNPAVSIDTIFEVLKYALQKDNYFLLDKSLRRTLLNWGMHCFWSAKKLFNHLAWMSLYEEWKAVFYEHMNRDECDEAMFVHFILYHKMGNSYQTLEEWKVYNEEISRVGGVYYKDWGLRHNLPATKNSVTKNGKIIIGFLQDRLVENSPYKVQYSVWKSLMESGSFRDKYEIRVYLMSYLEKSHNDTNCIEALRQIGISVWDGAAPFYRDGFYHNHLDKAVFIRNKILEDGVDILISPNNGYDISDFLVSVRCAPKQLFWCHGNFEYDIDGIDKKITHIAGIGDELGFDTFGSSNIRLLEDAEAELAKQQAADIRSRFSEDKIILGTIGRLVKIDNDEFLSMLANVLNAIPNSVYLACGSGNIASISEKLVEYGIDNRVFFEGFVDAKIYSFVIDITLNTFPQIQGESVRETNVWGGVPIVQLWVEESHGTYVKREDQDWLDSQFYKLQNRLKRNGYSITSFDKDLLIWVANRHHLCVADYIDMVSFLSEDKNLLNEIKRATVENYKKIISDKYKDSAQKFILSMDKLCH